MATGSNEIKALPAQLVAQASAIAPGFGPENIGPVIRPLFDRLYRDLIAAGLTPVSHPVATYEAVKTGDGVAARAFAAFPADADAAGGPVGTAFVVTELPAVPQAVTTVHYGLMRTIGESWDALNSWIIDNGYEAADRPREVYLVTDPEPEENWVTELQQPVTR
jgi:effector-binding domain-containing protein